MGTNYLLMFSIFTHLKNMYTYLIYIMILWICKIFIISRYRKSVIQKKYQGSYLKVQIIFNLILFILT